MAGISDKAIKTQYAENKRRFNDRDELQNKEFSDGSGLELYDAVNRMYDPQIGRFFQIDQLAEINEGWSPYSFAYDNPITFNDPIGLMSDSSHPQTLQEVTVTPGQNTGVHLASVGATGPGDITADPISSAPSAALVGGGLIAGAAEAGEGAGLLSAILEGGLAIVESSPPVAVATVVGGSVVGLLTARSNYSPPYNPVGDIAIGISKPYIPPTLLPASYPRVPTVFPFPGFDPLKPPPGFIWKGQPGSKAGDKDGNYTNPGTGESLRPELDHKEPIGPHWDYKDVNEKWHRLYPDGTSEQKKDR